jgi:hypothetical protein
VHVCCQGDVWFLELDDSVWNSIEKKKKKKIIIIIIIPVAKGKKRLDYGIGVELL